MQKAEIEAEQSYDSRLVVEDEPLLRMDTSDRLQELGFKVFEAGHADEAIEILDANDDIRIIFTDIDMPGSMDGLKLAAAVRDRWPPVKIIVTSGHHKVALADLPEGSAFFTKPYEHLAIARSIWAMLSI